MFSFQITVVILLSIFTVSFALPTPEDEITGIDRTINADDRVPVGVFDGNQVYVNKAAILNTTSTNPATKAIRSIIQRRYDDDTCYSSTFLSHPGPFAWTSHCWSLYNYASSISGERYEITGSQAHQSWIMTSGDCTFYAGDNNVLFTVIGNTDVRDLIRDGVNKWQSGGVVACQGVVGCDNWTQGQINIPGISKVYWTVMRT